MIRLITLVLVSIFITNVSLAQFHLGIKAGVNVNSLSWNGQPADSGFQTKSSIAFHIGLFSKIQATEKLSVIPELQYSVKGFKSGDARTDLSYIDLPVMMSYSLVKALSIDLGPEVGYLLLARQHFNGHSVDRDVFKKVDFGIAAGLRVNITEKISIIPRYYYGITPVIEITDATGPSVNNIAGTFPAHNQTIQFSVAYQLR